MCTVYYNSVSFSTVAPSIVVEPMDLNVTQNEATLIQCEASGIPMPTIFWFWTDIVFNFEQLVDDDGKEL